MTDDPNMARTDALEAFLADPTAKEAMDFLGIPPTGPSMALNLLLLAFNSGYVAGAKYVMKEVAS